jgi:hypothetical protein
MDTHPLASAYCGGNAILDRLSPHEREDLLSHLSVYIEEEGSVLRARNRPIDAVHFPIDAVYSVVVELSQGHTYEVDVIGRTGVVGAEIAIGAEIASRTVLCQAGGGSPNCSASGSSTRSRRTGRFSWPFANR